jgi:hypothetical protein
LVITHVDQDHILGVLAMLKDVERPEEFSDVWFNGFDRPAERQRVRKLRTRGRWVPQHRRHRAGLPWNNAFRGRAIEVGRPQTPFDDTAEFTIVAPDRTLLENLSPGGRKSVATTA